MTRDRRNLPPEHIQFGLSSKGVGRCMKFGLIRIYSSLGYCGNQLDKGLEVVCRLAGLEALCLNCVNHLLLWCVPEKETWKWGSMENEWSE